jgi:hypothetical protein
MSPQVNCAPHSGMLTIYSLVYKFGLECVLHITPRHAEEYVRAAGILYWRKNRGFSVAIVYLQRIFTPSSSTGAKSSYPAKQIYQMILQRSSHMKEFDFNVVGLNFAVEWVTSLLRVQKVLSSKFYSKAGCHVLGLSRLRSVPVICNTSNYATTVSFLSHTIHCLLLFLSFDVTRSELLTASLNKP